MVADIRTISKHRHACAKERLKVQSQKDPLKLFKPSKPLEFIAIDMLGPLTRAARDHKYILAITDRFSKLTRAIPFRSIKALSISKALVHHWVLAYGPPVTVLSDNSTQFTSRLFQFGCTELKMRSVTTATYQLQTNGQCERFNRTILEELRAFVSEHPKSWPEYAELLAFSYNTQFHPSLGCTPFDLILSYPPVSLTLRPEPSHQNSREPRKYWNNSKNRFAG